MAERGGAAVTPLSNRSSVSTRTNASALSHCDQLIPSANAVFLLIYTLVFLVGLILNGFTLKVYFCRAQQQVSSSVTVYLKNLAAADFFISLCLPLRITNYASSSVHVRRVYCNFGASAFYLNMYASILFMGYVAANRYLKIIHPLGTHFLQTVRAAYIVSMVTWLVLVATMSMYVLLSLLTQEPSPPAVSSAVDCDVLHSRQLAIFYKMVHVGSAAAFLLVLVSLVFFYSSTSHRLSRAQTRQPASSGCTKLAKSRRNMLVLVGVFCVCFVPYHLVRLPYAFLRQRCAWRQAFYYLKELTITVAVLNVCLDPLIYFIFCKAFRAQLSLRRRSSTTQATALVATTERRSSDGRAGTVRFNRKTSLTAAANQTGVL
ncbi:P2Y purinoceptor 14-like [Etheostoma cragini]|uniref:P2Y purinoceptor 14-like n=1 Tax=Etheostoma cragini TaxID=417921 RepID=UPI00155E110D|nr:P2Y purinoceptor 14-like [Etheostoma cragini]